MLSGTLLPTKSLSRTLDRSMMPSSDGQRDIRPDFIHYEPVPLGVPTITRPDLGLRISADVPIPRDPLIQPDELLEDSDAYRPPSPLAPLSANDVEDAAMTRQFQTSEEEQKNERIEYEQGIQQQIKKIDARTTVLDRKAGNTQVQTSADETPEHPGNVERSEEADNESINDIVGQTHAIGDGNLQLSSVAPVTREIATMEETPVANTRSARHASITTSVSPANASAEALNSPQAPSQRSVSSAQSSTKGRRKTFATQSNTLLSWVIPVSRQPSENGNTPQPLQPSPSHSAPLPIPSSSNRSTPRLPQPSSRNSTPRPAAQGTSAAASPSPDHCP
ncbi:hypothetical protein DM02DRAFT_664474 [Periconia macrospinosa]|uniref:Uncharacterized protein n=1 Tax=Periconia macrospinosa TaxID=97972 RepID=A0A2V1CYZ6_9PLEO|nr:hypothetical protein DM02DRAFT_664474 [Periconia macrospinosa]